MTSSDAIASLVRELTVTDPDGTSWIDLASDPVAVDTLGRAVADLVRDLDVDAVLGWWAPDEAVLAHAIAAALRVPRSAAELELGLITLSPALRPASRVLVVATDFDVNKPAEPLAAILEGDGHSLVATVSLSADEGARITRHP